MSRAGGALAGITVCAVTAWAQTGATFPKPLRTTPTEALTVKVRFRDWGPTTIAGTTILGGNSSGRGGLYAVDTVTGKMKWSALPTGLAHGTPFVATAPAVSGDVVIVPMGNTLVGLSLATGKELWRGPATAQGATVAVNAGLAYVVGDDGNFYAFDAKTGREKWKVAFSRRGSCEARPVVRDDVVYVTGNVVVTPADANRSASYYYHLFALDAASGQERWRYPSAPSGNNSGVCHERPVVSADTLFSASGATLYAINLATGRDRWKPVEVRRPVDGRERAVEVFGLVDAGPVLVGLTSRVMIAFDKASGKTAWEVPGEYSENAPSTAAADGVLYFQGQRGRLDALDLSTRAVLWSFSRPTAEANWSFGYVTPIDGGLWVDSYQALVKLQ